MNRTRRKIFYNILVSAFLLGMGCRPADTREMQEKASDPATAVDRPAGEEHEFAFGTEITITGKLISTFCYGSEDPGRHDVSDECATASSRNGMPVAVLENDKRVREAWILLTNPLILADYMNRTVRVRGEVRGKGVLMPVRVELEAEDGWMFIM